MLDWSDDDSNESYIESVKRLWCCICGEERVLDDFSDKMRRESDEERYCLRHTSTSAFGSTFKKPKKEAVISININSTSYYTDIYMYIKY